MSCGTAHGRLAEERKSWRKNHPYGFIAKPETKSDGSVNLMCWKCFVPGKAGTDWEGGHYPVTLQFSENYPTKPPKCIFPSGFLHSNVFSNGQVCLSILNDAGWKPSISVKQILLGIQNLLVQPNPGDAANYAANRFFIEDPGEYKRLSNCRPNNIHLLFKHFFA